MCQLLEPALGRGWGREGAPCPQGNRPATCDSCDRQRWDKAEDAEEASLPELHVPADCCAVCLSGKG